jgi:hypothetical protein
MTKKQRQAEQAERQARHDRYVARLDGLTTKPLAELTWDEFKYLIGRVFLPVGETPQSTTRREWLGALVSYAHWQAWRAYRDAVDVLYPRRPYPSFPELDAIERSIFDSLKTREWPVCST